MCLWPDISETNLVIIDCCLGTWSDVKPFPIRFLTLSVLECPLSDVIAIEMFRSELLARWRKNWLNCGYELQKTAGMDCKTVGTDCKTAGTDCKTVGSDCKTVGTDYQNWGYRLQIYGYGLHMAFFFSHLKLRGLHRIQCYVDWLIRFTSVFISPAAHTDCI